ncbi:MAG TPA: quinone-dependent dihydroorotate dehydrogenase [Rubricoccaceae bacterium]|nr:quinone-dependent dihydroorotate dehydrogenase [Rubricoccaceae bacterium]
MGDNVACPPSAPLRLLSSVYRYLRPLLFRLDAERAHGMGAAAAHVGQRARPLVRALYRVEDERLAQTVWGLRFASPVGLAAGFDKNAALVPFWAALGFGFAEVGSVTARPSAGNPRPRAFRLERDRALVNRMGLNNDGAEAIAARLAGLRKPEGFVLGVNVAKTHDPLILGDEAIEDFRQSVRRLLPHADFLALNVSCPNTAEGKTFEEPAALDALLAAVFAERTVQLSEVPVLVKLSPPGPDGLDTGAVDELVAISRRHGVAGFIAVNTASDRSGCTADVATLDRIGAGGLSGRPLADRATTLLRHLYRTTDGVLPLVGVGGVDSAEAAYARLRAGASLVELYTALVYEGPGVVKRINRGLLRLFERDRLGSVAEAVGLDA